MMPLSRLPHSIQPDNMMSAPDGRSKQAPQSQGKTISRQTRDGRTLTYRLEVLQQPERARACGSGPKSSNDRRPVDPPPVVVLKIYEGSEADIQQGLARDITFDYNVDFFCYASLEQARVIATGRVQAPQANQVPVLSGFPVAGCCYLDRPDAAGYFIFPDLSVRHEGRYRLVFSLYELVKDEKDLDQLGGEDSVLGEARHRMDLSSAEFTVYSAKKFPGLTESTSLSRTVAEQGCRVRIRRDIRMRRREPTTSKPGPPEDFSNTEDQYKRGGTQPPDHYRARSTSNSSMNRPVYPERRPSVAESEGPLQSPYANPQSSSILGFGAPKGFMAPLPPGQNSNPQSTPVSPAHTSFPSSYQGNAVPSSPSYQSPAFSPFHPSDADGYAPYSHTPLAARPSRTDDLRSSVSSAVSTDGRRMPTLLPQLGSGSEYQPRYQHKLPMIAPHPTKLWPEQATGPLKRSADESFATQAYTRNVEGDRQEHDVYVPGRMEYRSANGEMKFRHSMW